MTSEKRTGPSTEPCGTDDDDGWLLLLNLPSLLLSLIWLVYLEDYRSLLDFALRSD